MRNFSLIVAGSRTLQLDDEVLDAKIRAFIVKCGQRPYSRSNPELTIVSGGCRGVDVAGERWAHDNGAELLCIDAEWERHGKMAGRIRNHKMAQRADAALVFMVGEPTNGSSNMITWMGVYHKPCEVWLMKNGKEEMPL